MEIRGFEVEMALNITKLKGLCDRYELLGSISVAKYREYMRYLEDSCVGIDNDYTLNVAKYIVKNSVIDIERPTAWVLEHILNKCIKYSVYE